MKIRIAYTIFALILAGVAGIAWAAQPAVEAPAAETPEATAPAQDGTIVPSELDKLFVEPVDQGACCRGDCFSWKIECRNACDFDQACLDQCNAAYDTCIANC